MDKSKQFIPAVVKISQEIERLKGQKKQGGSNGQDKSQSPADIIDDNLETIKSLSEDIYNVSKITDLLKQLQDIGLGQRFLGFGEMVKRGKTFDDVQNEIDKSIMKSFMGLNSSRLQYLKKALVWHNDKSHCFTPEQLMSSDSLVQLLHQASFSELSLDGDTSNKKEKHPLCKIFDEIYNTNATSTGKCEVLFSLLLYKGSVKKEKNEGAAGGLGDVSFIDGSGSKRHLEVKEGNSHLEYDLSSQNLDSVKNRVKAFLKKIWEDFEEGVIPQSSQKILLDITAYMWHNSFSRESVLQKNVKQKENGYLWSQVKGGRDEFFANVADYIVIVSEKGKKMLFASKENAEEKLKDVRFDLPDKYSKVSKDMFGIKLNKLQEGRVIDTGVGRGEGGWIYGKLYV